MLGIDGTRRGRTRWEQDADTGKWQLTRDRRHTGFVDALGTGGMLGQVEGRAVADVLAWLSTTPLTWRRHIRYVAIDMSATYRAAVRAGLPDVIVVVDHFPRRPARQQDASARTRCRRSARGHPRADLRPGRTDVTRAAIGRQRVRRPVRRLRPVVLRFGWRREAVRA
ncbi:transposase [Streptomyces sp. NBC_00057]|uniref:transposase n=1 Tax=Streptomyces sp. NBC_00057 TaxID=2975634 RepID=UPI00386B8967